MITTILKYSMTILLSYIVLSFQFNDKYLFDYLTELTGPLGENIQRSLGDAFDKSWDKTKDYGKQLFTNSAPVIKEKYQSARSEVVKKVTPAVKKKTKEVEQDFLDDLKQEEMNHLDSIIDSGK